MFELAPDTPSACGGEFHYFVDFLNLLYAHLVSVPILHIGFPDDIFQLKLSKKIDQIAADSPHLGKNKADNFHLSMHAKSKHKLIQFIQVLLFLYWIEK